MLFYIHTHKNEKEKNSSPFLFLSSIPVWEFIEKYSTDDEWKNVRISYYGFGEFSFSLWTIECADGWSIENDGGGGNEETFF